jgi:two-component system nitrate/nitrite response regulator NarL
LIARRFVVGFAFTPPSVVQALRAAIGADVKLLDAARIPVRSTGEMDLLLVGPGADRRATDRLVATGYPVVVLADARDEQEEYLAIEHGASGYQLLRTPVATLRRLLWAALAGEPIFGRRALGRWLRAQGRAATRRSAAVHAGLTPRQQQILELIAEGATTKEIAGKLRLKNTTVDKHISNLLKRVGVPNRAAAIGALGVSALHYTGRQPDLDEVEDPEEQLASRI